MTTHEQATPALSIIMPCFNRAHGIKRVLSAYDRQAGGIPFELIAVDDGSTDDTTHILKAHRPVNYTLRVFQMQKNGGPAAARNQGMSMACAPLIAFVGDDICPAVDFVALHVQAHHRHTPDGTAILERSTGRLICRATR